MKKPERYFYPAVFTYDPGKEIAVVFPDLIARQAERTITMRFCPRGNCSALSCTGWKKMANLFPLQRRFPRFKPRKRTNALC